MISSIIGVRLHLKKTMIKIFLWIRKKTSQYSIRIIWKVLWGTEGEVQEDFGLGNWSKSRFKWDDEFHFEHVSLRCLQKNQV